MLRQWVEECEAANSSEISKGRASQVGRALGGQRGIKNRGSLIRESGRSDKRDFRMERRIWGISLRWAWPAFRGDAEELPRKASVLGNKNRDMPPVQSTVGHRVTLGLEATRPGPTVNHGCVPP